MSNDGLYHKYNVTRTDGQEKDNADYFVLDLANDVHARRAAYAYAKSVYAAGNHELGSALMRRIISNSPRRSAVMELSNQDAPEEE